MISDSINTCAPDSTGFADVLVSFQESIMQSNSIVYSFWLSIVAILLIYLLKCFVKIKPNGEIVFSYAIDFFLDLCIMSIPLIVLGSHDAKKDTFGYFFILAAIVVVIVGTFLRKKWSEFYNDSKLKAGFACGIGAIIISFVLLTIVYIFISKIWILQA